MIVPSRSIKTAGGFSSSEIMLEAREKFIARDSSGAKFADDNGAAVISNFGCFNRSGVANERESEKRDGSVARAGNVKNLTRFCRNMMPRFVALKKHHALFAERDENVFRVPFLEQDCAGANKIDIFLRKFVRITPRNPGREKSFGAVRFHNGHASPIDQISGVGIGRDKFRGGARIVCDLRD